MRSVGKSVKAVTIAISTPAIVAPTSGTRSRKNMSTASGTANGVPSNDSTMKALTPAIVAMVSAPAT